MNVHSRRLFFSLWLIVVFVVTVVSGALAASDCSGNPDPKKTAAFAKMISDGVKTLAIPDGRGSGDHPSKYVFQHVLTVFQSAAGKFITKYQPTIVFTVTQYCPNETNAVADDCDTEYRHLSFDLTSLIEGDAGSHLQAPDGLNCLTATFGKTDQKDLLALAQDLVSAAFALVGIIDSRDTHERLVKKWFATTYTIK